MEKLVTVIVPVYNVEKFVGKCITSIIDQTYSNLEIIVVNDGSTDSSEGIIQSFNDKRIHLVNKQNGGLSSARNYGIEYAHGEFISFIDSDDFIDKNMIKNMVELLNEYKADVVCCNFDYCNENDIIFKNHKASLNIGKAEIYNSSTAIQNMLYENYYKCFACNKIFKRSLFENIRFPEGRLFEDIFTMYQVFRTSKEIIFLNKSYYHYRIRKGSITQKKFDKRNYELIEAINPIINDNYNNKKILIGCLIYYMYYIDDSIKGNSFDTDIYTKYKKLYKRVGGYFYTTNKISMIRKVQMILLNTFPKAYSRLYKKITGCK